MVTAEPYYLYYIINIAHYIIIARAVQLSNLEYYSRKEFEVLSKFLLE